MRLFKEQFTMSGGNFHVRVICGGLYTKIFGILTQKFMIVYGFKNIE